MTVAVIIESYGKILAWSLPICITIHLANLVISTFLRAAFGGTLEFRE